MDKKREKRIRRHKKIRMHMYGTKERPRFFVFRSNQHIYAQLIDDGAGGGSPAKILISVSDRDLEGAKGLSKGKNKSDIAKQVGRIMAQKAIESKIERVVFDRGGVVFHGRVKALADGAREGGLQF